MAALSFFIHKFSVIPNAASASGRSGGTSGLLVTSGLLPLVAQ